MSQPDSDDHEIDEPADEKVGYKNPPKSTRFKKGQSGNPSGRPRKTQPVHDTFREAFSKPVLLKIEGRTTAWEANKARARMLVAGALRGRLSDIKLILQADKESELLRAMTEQSRLSGVLLVPEQCADEDAWEARYGPEAQANAAAAKSAEQ